MHASRPLDRLGIDLESVTSLVPVDHGIDVLCRPSQISPVLVLTALCESSGDARRRAKVQVGNTHPDLDPLPVRRDGTVPLGAVGSYAVVDLIEVEDLRSKGWLTVDNVSRKSGLDADSAQDGGSSGAP